MGNYVEVNICRLDCTNMLSVGARIDPSYTLTVIPSSIARRLGLETLRYRVVVTDGGKLALPEVFIRINVMGTEAITRALVLNSTHEVILGNLTLEEVGMAYDPVTCRLIRKTPYIPIRINNVYIKETLN